VSRSSVGTPNRRTGASDSSERLISARPTLAFSRVNSQPHHRVIWYLRRSEIVLAGEMGQFRGVEAASSSIVCLQKVSALL
jgi:hypothetical protein